MRWRWQIKTNGSFHILKGPRFYMRDTLAYNIAVRTFSKRSAVRRECNNDKAGDPVGKSIYENLKFL